MTARTTDAGDTRRHGWRGGPRRTPAAQTAPGQHRGRGGDRSRIGGGARRPRTEAGPMTRSRKAETARGRRPPRADAEPEPEAAPDEADPQAAEAAQRKRSPGAAAAGAPGRAGRARRSGPEAAPSTGPEPSPRRTGGRPLRPARPAPRGSSARCPRAAISSRAPSRRTCCARWRTGCCRWCRPPASCSATTGAAPGATRRPGGSGSAPTSCAGTGRAACAATTGPAP